MFPPNEWAEGIHFLNTWKIKKRYLVFSSWYLAFFPVEPHNSNTGFSTAFFTAMRNCTACLPSTRRWS